MARSMSYIWPLPQPFIRITSPFGGRINPITGKPQHHRGIDVAANMNTPIFATEEGVVRTAALEANAKTEGGKAAGNYIEITHPDGSVSRYLHQTKFNVQKGQQVKKGDIIGYVGSTGASTGPHLHFEIWTGTPFSSKEHNPVDVLAGGTKAVINDFVRDNWRMIAAAGAVVGVSGALLVVGKRRRSVMRPVPSFRPALANPRLRMTE
jgi:murein DD-endopeptidase MepM/ murein hydrolase activator NlpD